MKAKQRNHSILAVHPSVLFMKSRHDLHESRDLLCWFRPRHNCVPSVHSCRRFETIWRLLLRVCEMLSFSKATGYLTLDLGVYRTLSAAIKAHCCPFIHWHCFDFLPTYIFNLCSLCREERDYSLSFFLLKFQLLPQRDLSEKSQEIKA